jgi:uncharacterized membrane protein
VAQDLYLPYTEICREISTEIVIRFGIVTLVVFITVDIVGSYPSVNRW